MTEPSATDVAAPSQEFVIDVFASACPSRATFEDVTSKWASLVLIALGEGPYRFGELRRKVQGVSEKMLSQALRALERDGMIVRTAHDIVPPRVDYALTALGMEVARTMRSLADVLEAAVPEVTRARQRYDATP
jgi:DNA-binding HxlR family transcriptional regulator